MKKVSIIVPIYNIKEYLERCVKSIQEQTYSNLEIILVDDGSTDGTGALCDELAKQDERIIVRHKENGGSSSARNVGLELATGDYIGFVDSDDYITSVMYEKLVSALERYQVNIAQIGRREIAENGDSLPPICISPEEETIFSSNEFIKELLLHKGDCSFCTKLFRKEIFQKRSFPVGALNEDFRLLIEILMQKESIVSLPEVTYCVFYRIGSNTRKESKEQFSRVYGDCVDNADWVWDVVTGEDEELREIAMRFGLFQRNEYLLHIPISQMTKENKQYQDIKRYIKTHRKEVWKSRYLTKKNKLYLLLFSVEPKLVRKVHAKLRGID